jgi:hypothetical protein
MQLSVQHQGTKAPVMLMFFKQANIVRPQAVPQVVGEALLLRHKGGH